MRILRLEHAAEKVGPWCMLDDDVFPMARYRKAAFKQYAAYGPFYHDDPSKKIVPADEDIEGFEPGTHLCAFETVDDLKRCFSHTAGLEALGETGYVLREFEIAPESLLRGQGQCAFKRDDAVEVHEITLDKAGLERILAGHAADDLPF